MIGRSFAFFAARWCSFSSKCTHLRASWFCLQALNNCIDRILNLSPVSQASLVQCSIFLPRTPQHFPPPPLESPLNQQKCCQEVATSKERTQAIQRHRVWWFFEVPVAFATMSGDTSDSEGGEITTSTLWMTSVSLSAPRWCLSLSRIITRASALAAPPTDDVSRTNTLQNESASEWDITLAVTTSQQPYSSTRANTHEQTSNRSQNPKKFYCVLNVVQHTAQIVSFWPKTDPQSPRAQEILTRSGSIAISIQTWKTPIPESTTKIGSGI
eukprot:3301074-Amphidinium_carterae.1